MDVVQVAGGTWRNVVIGTALLMSILTLQKFIAVLAPPFLLAPVLYGIGVWLLLRKSGRGGVILILVLHAILMVIFTFHLIDKGFDPDNYQVINDFVMVILGIPIAIAGVIGGVKLLSQRNP